MTLGGRMLITASTAVIAIATGSVAARALDLETVLREVAERNPSLESRRALVDAAEARVAPAGAWPSPMVELGVVNVPTSGRLDMDPMTMKMVGVSQRVPLFGSNRLGRRAAGAAVDAERAAATMAHYELFGATWEAFADAYYATDLERHAEAHRALMNRLVESARARYESGRGRLEDVLRADAERARALVDLAAFRSEQEAARARLDALRGVGLGADPDSLAAPPLPAVPTDAGAWLVAVSPEHPRLRELDAQVKRYRLAGRAARRMVWPDLELRGSYGFRGRLEDGMEQDDMFSASVGFMVPVFARSRELSEATEMDAMARASEAERRAAELELQRQVRSAHAAATAGGRSVSLLADTVVVTQRRAVDASWSAYTAGTTDLWRVFEAGHALYNEEIALTRARQLLARAEARMLALTGRGDLLGIELPPVKEASR